MNESPEDFKTDNTCFKVRVGMLVLCGIIFLTYSMAFVYFPNRMFIYGTDSTCQIKKAKQFCWRRQLFSMSLVEEGSYTCWLFHVQTGNGTMFLAQYRVSKRMSKLTNLCTSFEECGSYTMQCRLSRGGNLVVLRWKFPTFKFVLCILISFSSLAVAAWQGYHLPKRQRVARQREHDIASPPLVMRRTGNFSEDFDLWIAQDDRNCVETEVPLSVSKSFQGGQEVQHSQPIETPADAYSKMPTEDVGDHVVPVEITPSKLKACMSCSLIKNAQQFVMDGCDNCPFMSYQNDRERVLACTTSSFVGTYVILEPRTSWVAKWQRVSTFVPGAYAISIDAKMPDDIVEQLEENRMRLHTVLATAEKAE